MQLVWSYREPLSSYEGRYIPSALPKERIEAVTQLFITFWTKTPGDADLESSAITPFSISSAFILNNNESIMDKTVSSEKEISYQG